MNFKPPAHGFPLKFNPFPSWFAAWLDFAVKARERCVQGRPERLPRERDGEEFARQRMERNCAAARLAVAQMLQARQAQRGGG